MSKSSICTRLPTVTTKAPFLGLSGLILTVYPSFFRRADNFSALFLNTPHDLQASITTDNDDADDADDADAAADDADAFAALTAFADDADDAFTAFTILMMLSCVSEYYQIM